jgi:Protein of unknown function (DUF1579)
MTRSSASVLSLLFISATAFAQEPAKAPKAEKAEKPAAEKPAPAEKPAAAAAPAMAPAPELDATFKSWEGTWKCETTFAPNAMAPGSPEMKMKATAKIKKDKDLGGFVYKGVYEIKKTKANPGMRGEFTLGYDAGSKSAVMTSVDNMGSIGIATAPIGGDTLTFQGDSYMMGQKVKTRESFTRKGDKEIEHKAEVDMGKGFIQLGTDVCKK